LLLYRAEHALTASSSPPEEAKDWVREALRLGNGLPRADQLYARGLIADRSPEAADLFRDAVTVDPAHHRARASLVMLLLFLGRLEEAEAQARERRLALPDHAVPPFADAWCALLRGDPPPDRGALARVVPAEGQAALDRFLQLAGEVVDAISLLGVRFQSGGGVAAWLQRRPKTLEHLAELERLRSPAMEPFDFGAPLAARLTATSTI